MSWTTPNLRSAGFFVTASVYDNEIINNLLLLKTSIDDSGNLAPPAPTTLTLATDACTPTQNVHKVDTEAAGATDNLSTLTIAGNIRTGHLLRLGAANVAHVVTVKDSVGNIVLKMGDFALSAADRWLELMLVGTTWYEVGRSDLNTAVVGPELKSYRETKAAPTIASGTLTIDYAAANIHAVSLNANITTLAFSNLPASGKAATVYVLFTADGTLRTITWGGAVKWPAAAAPTMTSTNGKVDIVGLTTVDGGTTWYAFLVGQNY